MKNIMTRAWQIAKRAARRFSGKAKAYFAEALRIAWAEFKDEVANEVAIAALRAQILADYAADDARRAARYAPMTEEDLADLPF